MWFPGLAGPPTGVASVSAQPAVSLRGLRFASVVTLRYRLRR